MLYWETSDDHVLVGGTGGDFRSTELFLQNSLGAGVTKMSTQFPLKVSVYATWRQVVMRRAKEVLAGAGAAGLVTDWLHLDADSGHGQAPRRRSWVPRVPGVEARLGLGRWVGAGDLQVQSDAGKQWWNYLLLHQPPSFNFDLIIAEPSKQFGVI